MAHEVGLKESQQLAAHITRHTIVTNTNVVTEIARITPLNGEAGGLLLTFNAVSGEATPRHVNREFKLGYKKTQAGAVVGVALIANPNYQFADAGGENVTVTGVADGADVVLRVVGVNGMEIRHTLDVQRISGTIHESFAL